MFRGGNPLANRRAAWSCSRAMIGRSGGVCSVRSANPNPLRQQVPAPRTAVRPASGFVFPDRRWTLVLYCCSHTKLIRHQQLQYGTETLSILPPRPRLHRVTEAQPRVCESLSCKHHRSQKDRNLCGLADLYSLLQVLRSYKL
ncbi:CDP-diacylglycerol pyrophosphatase [Clarias magur]|uniref:CDP-diacylglycerol pyrophosphatase n=1 Tax=Clarias magur TaxID=1594786 RepID=A0A8J4X9G7_CLAMG|nr:CDP-diacylglycerol pyrophosphatase [Clarias magur]